MFYHVVKRLRSILEEFDHLVLGRRDRSTIEHQDACQDEQVLRTLQLLDENLVEKEVNPGVELIEVVLFPVEHVAVSSHLVKVVPVGLQDG